MTSSSVLKMLLLMLWILLRQGAMSIGKRRWCLVSINVYLK